MIKSSRSGEQNRTECEDSLTTESLENAKLLKASTSWMRAVPSEEESLASPQSSAAALRQAHQSPLPSLRSAAALTVSGGTSPAAHPLQAKL